MEEEQIQTKKSPSPDITKSWVFLDPNNDQSSEDESKKPSESDSDSISIISEGGYSTNSKSEEERDEEETAKVDEENDIEERIEQVQDFNSNSEDVESVRQISDIFENIQSNESLFTEKYIKMCSRFISNALIVIIVAAILFKLEYCWFGGHQRGPKNAIKMDQVEADYNFDLLQQYEMRHTKPNCKFGQYFDVDGNQHCHKKNRKHYKRNDKSAIDNPIIKNSIKSHNFIINAESNKTIIDKIDKSSNHEQIDKNESGKKLKEIKMKEKYLKEKEKFLIEKEHDLLKRERKLKEHEKKSKKQGKKGDDVDFKTQDKKYKRKFEKANDFVYKSKTSSKERPKQDRKQYLKINKSKKFVDKKNITGGDWYYKLHQGRNNFRKKEQASDWLFERAKLRSLKRNKAYWYFQWMFDRERLRSA